MDPTLRSRSPAAGFTLVEILVVVAILGLLVAMVVPNLIDHSDRAREDIARTNAVVLARAVKGYRATRGQMPASLQQLVEADAKGRSEIEELPLDPWGRDYVLRACDEPPGWEVLSMGPDGSAGGDDDISSRGDAR